ncbi:hypothetical protein ENUP19_0171G0010 [Entamoeba nuttalli]|uniref:Rho-GAP domain-containing protein n=1 Tax=Entamoeba nuttalli TaxID=412467 RepID=A0ABQ0DMD5_9EUKA
MTEKCNAPLINVVNNSTQRKNYHIVQYVGSQWRVPLPIFRAMQYLEEHKGDKYVGIFRMNGGTAENEEN